MELPILRNVIGSWYHQDAYLDFASDEEIWADIFAAHDSAMRVQLITQLTELLQSSNDAVISLWNSEAHSHTFTDSDEARDFFGSHALVPHRERACHLTIHSSRRRFAAQLNSGVRPYEDRT